MIKKESPGAGFDCKVFFQATRNANGPAAKALRLLETGAFSLFVSSTILDEIKETLTDPELRAKNRSLTDQVVKALLQHLTAHATLIRDVPERFSRPGRRQLRESRPSGRGQVPSHPCQGSPGFDERGSLLQTISATDSFGSGCVSAGAASKREFPLTCVWKCAQNAKNG